MRKLKHYLHIPRHPAAISGRNFLGHTMELITSKLLRRYVGEEFAGHDKWHKGNGPVHYLDPVERSEYHVRIFDKRLWDAAGVLLDTGDADVFSHSGGRAIYVWDEHQMLYCSASPQYYKFHHSSFIAGGAAACAGEIEVANGLVIYLNNKSGHYQPSTIQFLQFFRYLRGMGVDCRWTEISDGGFRS